LLIVQDILLFRYSPFLPAAVRSYLTPDRINGQKTYLVLSAALLEIFSKQISLTAGQNDRNFVIRLQIMALEAHGYD